MAQKKNTAEKIRELTEPEINRLGYDVWDVEFLKIGNERHLEITIDCEKGVDLSDCEKVHRAVEKIIDDADPIEESYYLDISSPGLERNIRTPEHFEKCTGMQVELKFFTQVSGKKSIIGTLTDYDKTEDSVTVTDKSGEKFTVPGKLISKATTYFEM